VYSSLTFLKNFAKNPQLSERDFITRMLYKLSYLLPVTNLFRLNLLVYIFLCFRSFFSFNIECIVMRRWGNNFVQIKCTMMYCYSYQHLKRIHSFHIQKKVPNVFYSCTHADFNDKTLTEEVRHILRIQVELSAHDQAPKLCCLHSPDKTATEWDNKFIVTLDYKM